MSPHATNPHSHSHDVTASGSRDHLVGIFLTLAECRAAVGHVQVDDEIATFPFISVGEVQPIKQESKHFEHYEITQTIRIYHNDINERVTLENIIHKMITELENGSYFVNGWQLDLLNCNYDISVEIDTSTQKYLRLFCELTFKGLLVD